MEFKAKIDDLTAKRAEMAKLHEQLMVKLQETVTNIHQLDGAIGVLTEMSAPDPNDISVHPRANAIGGLTELSPELAKAA